MSRLSLTTSVLVCLAGALVVAPSTPAAGIHTETTSSGALVATFTYVATTPSRSNGYVSFTDPNLTVTDLGSILLDTPVISAYGGAAVWPGGYGSHPSLTFARLTTGSKPQLVLTLYTGGAHCCYVDQVYDLDRSPVRKTEIDLADNGAELKTINGATVFVGADDGFAYGFTDYADSGVPIEVWRYQPGHFTDVTRQYPALIAKDAAFWWHEYKQTLHVPASQGSGDERGILAAWAAEEALLGHAASAKQTLLNIALNGVLNRGASSTFWPTGLAYVRALWRFLEKNGYLN